MKIIDSKYIQWARVSLIIGLLLVSQHWMQAQNNSIVLIHTSDGTSGYGVAWAGPRNTPDMIVTALHLVAGKKQIQVAWQGKTAVATVEKIYKPSDLALLKLKTPLNIPSIGLYSGDPPWETIINFWEIPTASTSPAKKTTRLEGNTSLANLSPKIQNEPSGLSKALCFDGDESYPGMKTSVINFQEANIRKAHSGSPLTYGDKILGMVDGGAKLVDGKPCIWAIPAADFNKLYSQGTPPAQDMVTCRGEGSSSKYLYSGIRPDNPFLTKEEVEEAIQLTTPVEIKSTAGTKLELHHNYTMSFKDVYETLFEKEQREVNNFFHPGDSITLNNLFDMTVNFYSEENTGVSIMIPDHCTITSSTDDYGTLNTVYSPDSLVALSFYVAPGSAPEDGLNAMNSFLSVFEEGQEFKPNEKEILSYKRYYHTDFSRVPFNSDSATVSVFYASMTFNDGNFLAVVLNVPDYQAVAKNPNERLYYYLMQECTLLSDFPLY